MESTLFRLLPEDLLWHIASFLRPYAHRCSLYNWEANSRNYVVSVMHNVHIPSYALWDGYSVQIESLEERLEWWKTLNFDSSLTVVCRQWIHDISCAIVLRWLLSQHHLLL